MKKLLVTLGVAFAAALSAGLFAACDDSPSGTEGLAYAYLEELNAYAVTGIGTATDTEIIIPSVYNDGEHGKLNVVSVGGLGGNKEVWNPDHGLYEFVAPSFTNVTIGYGITTIEDYAFDKSFNLTSITIPNSITEIGGSAFDSCNRLTSITYNGTKAEWNQIKKGSGWDYDTGDYTIHCTDGDI